MLDIVGLGEDQMPQIFESYEVVGNKGKCSKLIRTKTWCKGVAGGGDQAVAQ